MVRASVRDGRNSCSCGQAKATVWGQYVKNLIVNADDLGWTEGVNRGIAESHRNGIVSSASLLANGSAFESGVTLALTTASLGVGVHLNLSDGEPTAPPETVPSLLDKHGRFSGGPEILLARLIRRTLHPEEVMCEWNAQIEKILAAGINPTHLDGHKHVHMLPGLFAVALQLAKQHGIPAVRVSHEGSSLSAALAAKNGHHAPVPMKQKVHQALRSTPPARGIYRILARAFPRWGMRLLKLLAADARESAKRAGIATTDYFCGIEQTGELTKVGVTRLLKNLPSGTTELMCHPGYVDADLEASSTRLQESRGQEVEILTDPDIRNLVASEGIRLIDYSFVSKEVRA
jgi:chitin disaccharide deacetylase